VLGSKQAAQVQRKDEICGGTGFYVSDYDSLTLESVTLPETARIFDTTLRDGEQTPGVSLTVDEKIRIAHALDELGVDTIEAGFPATSEGETRAIKGISNLGLRCEVCALARSTKKDIDLGLGADVDCIHTFIATSDIHLKHKLKMDRDQVVEKAVEGITYAKEHGVTVEFSAEDASRTELDYLLRVLKAAQDAGADRINVPDTVGVMIPRAMGYLVGKIAETVSIPISVHCHDDFGLASSNSLASIENGASQIHVTINGLGERAGNASMEEVVMSLHSFYGVTTGIVTQKICPTSELVSRLTGVPVQPNRAIVGENAFAHESGIHVHGVLGAAATYEALTPEMVGNTRRIVLGKHTGAHAISAKLEEMGIHAGPEQISEISQRVKKIGDMGKKITDADLTAIAEAVAGKVSQESRTLELSNLTVVTGDRTLPTASLSLLVDGKPVAGSSIGDGPVDAAISTIKEVVKGFGRVELKEYRLEAITGGSNAVAEVTVKVQDDLGNLTTARGVSTDIVMASVEAMIEAINRLFARRKEEGGEERA
jgi:isopropylmalate/citramalate/homocitrate synthase-like protein